MRLGSGPAGFVVVPIVGNAKHTAWTQSIEAGAQALGAPKRGGERVDGPVYLAHAYHRG